MQGRHGLTLFESWLVGWAGSDLTRLVGAAGGRRGRSERIGLMWADKGQVRRGGVSEILSLGKARGEGSRRESGKGSSGGYIGASEVASLGPYRAGAGLVGGATWLVELVWRDQELVIG